MTEVFHHGARVLEQELQYEPIVTTPTSTIGLIYTAPDADPDEFPLNQPVLFLGDRYQQARLGSAGTGKDAFDAIYDQGFAPAVVGIRVAESSDIAVQLSALVGDYATRTGVHALYKAKNQVFVKPKILIAPGFTHQRVAGGITQIPVTDGGADYTDAGTSIVINGHGHGGGAKAKAVIQNGVITGVVILNSGLGYDDGLTVEIDGDGTGATLGVPVRGTAANPVVAELAGIAQRLRAVIIADAPNSNAEASVAYRNDWSSDRIYVCDNWGLVWDTTLNSAVAKPNSARVAGILARIDNQQGFWVSPSNQVINGIVGTARPIDDSGVGGESDYLNEHDVATVVHRGEGFKLWGNHAATASTLKRMLAGRRCLDAVFDSIEETIDRWAPGRPLNLAFFQGVADSANAYLRYMKSVGAIIGGKVWVEQQINPPDQLVAGKPKFSGNIEPVGVAEDIQFLFSRQPGYYADLMEQVVLNLR